MATLVALGATFLFWSQRTFALDEDGPGFLYSVSVAQGILPYHHVGYLELARTLKDWVFDGAAFPALLFASALCGGLGLGLFVFIALREGSRRRTWQLGAALASSPALWVQSTRVELHSAQLLGGVLILASASLAVSASRPMRALLLAVGCAAAVPLHATNLLLVPGAVWIGARRARNTHRTDVATALWCILGAAVGCWVGTSINSVGRGEATTGFVGDAFALVTHFFSGASLDFVVRELIQPWFPVVVVALLLLARRPRRLVPALPFLAAAVPGLVFFVVFGVPTTGGYFTSVLAALALAANVASGAPQGTDTARDTPLERALTTGAVIAFVALGAWRSHARLNAPLRIEREQISIERAARLVELLPEGGWLVCVETHGQSGSGRDELRFEIELSEFLGVAIVQGAPVTTVADRMAPALARAASEGTPIVLAEGWRQLAALDPRLEPHMLALITTLEQHYALEPLTRPEGTYLVGTPRNAEPR